MSMTTTEANLSDEAFQELLRLVHKLTGISIGQNRKSMLVGRLRKRLRANDLDRFEQYIELIKQDSGEVALFVDSVTTNETYFYRTPRVWDHLTQEFIPSWLARGENRPLRLWSAAASTGEEAHTAGILLEDVKRRHPRFAYQILGTDISARVVGVARQGVYRDRAIERFRNAHADLFDKYMVGNDVDGFKTAATIRNNISFQEHNLFRPRAESNKYDIVMLRNVLIYFNKTDQERVLSNIEQAMTPNGLLYIGESESLSQLRTGFDPVVPLVYRRRVTGMRDAA